MAVVTLNTGPLYKSMELMNKEITRTPVTRTTNNVNGEETLTEGTAVTINGVFFKRNEGRTLQKYGQLINDADALLMVKPDVTVNKDDLITYDDEVFRVDTKIVRKLGSTEFYHAFQLFRTE